MPRLVRKGEHVAQLSHKVEQHIRVYAVYAGGVGAGGGGGVAHKDGVVADTLHLYKWFIIAVGIVALAAAAHQKGAQHRCCQ